MGRYIIKRLLWLIPVMLIISFIAFALMYLSPGDPAELYLSQGGEVPSAETVELLRDELGLNASIPVQYWHWIVNIFHGNLGTSIFTGNPVSSEIAAYFPNTLRLALLATVLTLLLSIPLGVIAAVREGGIFDDIIRFICFVFGSLPGFFAAMLLILIFGVWLKILPTISSGNANGIWIPALTLTLTMSPTYIRQIRAAMTGELGEEYIHISYARGIKKRRVIIGGAFRSVLPSLVTLIGMNIGQLLGGTAIIETVCTYPGLGRLAVTSITNRDYPLMQGFVLVMAGIYVIINLAADLINAGTDPRVKGRLFKEMGGGSHAKKA